MGLPESVSTTWSSSAIRRKLDADFAPSVATQIAEALQGFVEDNSSTLGNDKQEEIVDEILEYEGILEQLQAMAEKVQATAITLIRKAEQGRKIQVCVIYFCLFDSTMLNRCSLHFARP